MQHLPHDTYPSHGAVDTTSPLHLNPTSAEALQTTSENPVACNVEATEAGGQTTEISSSIVNPMVRVDVAPENRTCRADWATHRLDPTEADPRMSALKCKLTTCPLDFILLFSLIMLGALYGAVALPVVLAVVLVDIVAIMMACIPAAVFLVYAFLMSPRYGRNVKLCVALILPPTIFCATLVYAVLWPIACIVLTFAIGVIQMMGGRRLPIAVLQWVIGDTLELCVMFPFLWDNTRSASNSWRAVLAPGEKVYDLRILSAVRSILVVFVGGITGLLIFLLVALILSFPAFCAGVRIAVWCVSSSPRICQLITLPLALAWLLISGPAWAGMFLVACPIAGLFSGLYALLSIQLPETPEQAWTRAIKEMLDFAKNVSVVWAMKGVVIASE
jgi:hypothetical protein